MVEHRVVILPYDGGQHAGAPHAGLHVDQIGKEVAQAFRYVVETVEVHADLIAVDELAIISVEEVARHEGLFAMAGVHGPADDPELI